MPRALLKLAPLLLAGLLAACGGPTVQPTPPDNGTAARKSAPAATQRPTPDAIFSLDPGTSRLPPDTDRTLQAIAQKVKADKNTVVRLESFVPSGGSREMNVSLSSNAVEQIRRRLVGQGVPSYRIKQAPLGEEHPDAQKRNSAWVELFLVNLPR